MSRVRVLQGANLKDKWNATKQKVNMNESADKIKQSIITYFRGVRTEWGKITWPEKNQVVVETFFVVAIVAIFTVFIYLVDIFFNWILPNVHR